MESRVDNDTKAVQDAIAKAMASKSKHNPDAKSPKPLQQTTPNQT